MTITRIDSTGLAARFRMHAPVARSGGRVVLANLTQRTRSVLMLGLRTLAALLMLSVVASRVNAEGGATIVGSWKISSYDIEFQNSGERRPFLGAQPQGFLIFTPQGRVISYLEAEGRKALATDEECVDAYWTIVAYTGKYRLEGNKWITSVDGAWNVELVGTELERTFELKGSSLSVTSSWRPLRYDTRLSRVRLTFERED